MEQFFESENTYDVFMNEIRMEDEPLQFWTWKNTSVQTEGSKNPKNNEKKIK